MIRTWVMALAMGAITAAPASAGPPDRPREGGATLLDIPYVPQSEALCGGAAAAMVLRYWGARDVVAEDFAPLVDRDGAGIRVDRLADGVRARGWNAVALTGTDAIVREQLARRRPVIALVSAGRNRYHYIVIAAWSDRGVIAHDPARAPDRVFEANQFERMWINAHRWMLVITPGSTASAGAEPSPARTNVRDSHETESAADVPPLSRCDSLVAAAIGRARPGDEDVERLLSGALDECPRSAAARRELAGYALTHGNAGRAMSLAADAVRLDPGDAHAWYLLGAANYVRRDAAGALDAWNHVGEPRLDLVTIDGLTNSSYRSVLDVMGVAHGEVITNGTVARARRRVADLPAVAASRVEVEPRGGGQAQIDVGVVERSTVPRSRTELIEDGARAVVDREIVETFANLDGGGDAWSASWRWWGDRPKVGFGYAAPALFGTHAVWRLEGSWEAQSYASADAVVRSERTRAAIGASDWLAPNWRWHATSGLDRWRGAGAFWFGSGGIERRTADDRATVAVGATVWSGHARFATAGVDGSWTSRAEPVGWRVRASAGGRLATDDAPMDLWEGAGAGHARAALLRAHPLLDGGIIAGPAFGRRIEHATVSIERWPSTMMLWGAGVAAFVDVASVQRQLDRLGPRAPLVDAGAGIRLRAAWLPGIVRVDYAHGLRDGADAVSVGLQVR